MHDFLFTFQSTHQALKGEKYHKKRGLKVKLIPTPFEIFAECGFSLEINLDENELEEIRGDGKWKYSECYLILSDDGRNRHYEKL
jgi:hypothetical protein